MAGDALPAEQKPHGPPFTVERYGTFGQSVIAERDWLLEEVERLRAAATPFCNTHGITWQAGCRGCSEAERLTETTPVDVPAAQCNHTANNGTTLVRANDKITCSVCKQLVHDFSVTRG